MCGICCIFAPTEHAISELHVEDQSRISRRGPDASNAEVVSINPSLLAMFQGFVLHLRGELTPQPVRSSSGDLLLWNGEVFGGIKMSEDDNDTQVLLELLSASTSDEDVINTLKKVKGPWAFIFWQAARNKLWFGRDVLGRRSLLWHFPSKNDDIFALSSVQIEPYEFSEVPSVGIFCVQFPLERDLSFASGPVPVTLFAWSQDVVWPGTSSRVLSSSTIPPEILHPLVEPRLFFQVDKELLVDSWIPAMNGELPAPDYCLPDLGCKSAEDFLQELLASGGTLQTADSGTLQTADSGTLQTADSGTLQSADSGTVQTADSGTLQTADSGTVQSADSGTVQTADSGTLQTSDSGTLQTADIGTLQTADIGTLQTSDSGTLQTAARQLASVLEEAVHRRVFNLPRTRKTTLTEPGETGAAAESSLKSARFRNLGTQPACSPVSPQPGQAKVAILFSGGIDSTILAALADRCVPPGEPIDLLNVAFELPDRQEQGKLKKQRNHVIEERGTAGKFSVPDRLTGYAALQELSPTRCWNFVEVNVTLPELQHFRTTEVRHLLYPLCTVLDDSIGCAIWFASRGQGILGNGPCKGQGYTSSAKVLLCGLGADEQLAGYSRHRARFQEAGWQGLVEELQMEVQRLSVRNLGRDDRIIADHGKEARHPFLDEDVVRFLCQTKVQFKADLRLPRGLGEKLLLRLCATWLGLSKTATLPKRAIQFGSRIAKLENRKEKASDVSSRLANDT